MFTTVYRPTNLTEFVGNKNIIQPFVKWLLDWNENDKKNKCALVSGLCGIGKDLIVDLLLSEYNCNKIELNQDDEIEKDYIHNTIKTKKTFDNKQNVLVITDIDSSSELGFITDLIKNSKIPIICICNNRYDQSIKPIVNYSLDIKMTKPTYQEVYVLLYKVVIAEKIKIKESMLRELYEQSNGDIRFILNNLQLNLFSKSLLKTKNNSKNIQSANVFETTGKLMSMDDTIDSKYDTFWLSNNLHPLMVQENYINNTFNVSNEYKKSYNLAYSADALSDSDLFATEVNMTNWEFESYVALSTINATSKCNKKTMIKFPQYLGKISTINKNKKTKLDYDKPKILESKIIVKAETQKEKKPRGRPKKNK
jgi:replication factor C subunit 1